MHPTKTLSVLKLIMGTPNQADEETRVPLC
jgi:hypothetical protein